MLGNGCSVGLGRITFILLPVITGIFLMECIHVIVPISFGQHTGSSNVEVLAISLYNCSVGEVLILLETITINQQVLRPHLQPVNGTVHSQDGGIEDVYLINLFRCYHSYRPCHCLLLNDGA